MRWTSTVHANTVDPELVRLMKQPGCSYVGFGVESGDPAILKRMGKGVTREHIIRARRILGEAGTTTMGFFIFGHPNETRRWVWRTIRFAVQLNPDVAGIGILVPYPGTETWELAIRGEGGYRKLSADRRDYTKQLGNAVELENIGRRGIEFYQILAYLAIYVLNLRSGDLWRVGRRHARLAFSILAKILFPKRVREGLMLFRRDGARARLRGVSGSGSWG